MLCYAVDKDFAILTLSQDTTVPRLIPHSSSDSDNLLLGRDSLLTRIQQPCLPAVVARTDAGIQGQLHYQLVNVSTNSGT